MLRGSALFALCTLWVLCGAKDARAEYHEWTLSAAPVYSFAYVGDRSLHGGGANLDVAFGITENLSLRASGLVSWHDARMSADGNAGSVSAFSAMAGLRYSLDVIRIVPTFEVGIGAIGFRGGARYAANAGAEAILKPVTGFGLELGFGFDWLVTRWFSFGWLLRYQTVLTDLTTAPVYLYTGPRVTFTLPR